MKKVMLKIEGMTCSGCSNKLEKYLNKQSGIKSASVNLIMASALVEYDEKEVNIKKIETFVKKAGFKSLGKYKVNNEEKNLRYQKIKFFIFGVLALILLYISMGHMLRLPILDFISIHTNPVNYSIILCVLAITFLIYGLDIIKKGYINLIHKSPSMDTLVSIGVISSFLYSIYGMIMILKGNYEYVQNLYFESTALIIFFIKLGRYIDKLSKDKTKEAIKKMVQITPNKAIIKRDGKEIEVTIDEIKMGDIVISRPGDKISVDGEIIFGKTHLDESFITGESKPITKKIGDKVTAGSINYDGYIEYKAEKIGKDSTISQIIKLVVEATNTKAPIARIADKVSGYFVPAVICVAILTFVIYILLGVQLNIAVITFVTILVVACPCALGLATPLAIVVSQGICANKGILVKKSMILENAERIDTVVFDKTGTLTHGILKIDEIYNFSDLALNELLQLVGSLEAKSTHPIGIAFKDYLNKNKISALDVIEFENIAGYGIKGKVNNKQIILGNAKILEKYNINNIYLKEEQKLVKNGNSIVYVIIEGKIAAIIGINDILRDNVKEVINKLKEKHIETIMLTGDNEETAKIIAEQVGIQNIIANVLPEEKVKVIKELREDNKFVLMCGDGINDSPSLVNANIGVSIHSGTDIAIDSADVILMNNNLNKIIDLINISKKTMKIIKQNLFWAFLYNILMIPIAMGLFRNLGITINPIIAGIAMMASSLTVTLNSLRLKTII